MTMRIRVVVVSLALLALAGCTGAPAGVTPVRDFDAGRYLGQWYEIARLDHRFERGLTRISATYTRRRDGGINVINRGFDAADGKWREARGRAYFLGDPTVASLKVTFFWPFYGGYHVIALDRARYQYALVCGPSRSYLWILAREPRLPQDTLQSLIKIARDDGFDTDALIFVDQDGGGAPR
jgi:apolipoprotein D and lipocalin family protein